MRDKPFRYISLGAGVQSTALLILSATEQRGIPKADVAIFADTQSEPPWVYEHLEVLRKWSSVPIEIVTAGSLEKSTLDLSDRRSSIPFFTESDEGSYVPLRRKCTSEYKIYPIQRKVRELLGYKPRQRVKEKAQAMIGISLDEATRMKPSRCRWIENTYPLVEIGISRPGCIKVIEAAGLQTPRKSACWFCPYHSDKEWANIRDNAPETWERALMFDKQIRNLSDAGVKRPVFLHRSLRPLEDVELRLNENQLGLWDEECEGMCGV